MASETAFEYAPAFADAVESGGRDLPPPDRFNLLDIYKGFGWQAPTGAQWLEATGVQYSSVVENGKTIYQYHVKTDQGALIPILTSDKAPEQAEPLIRTWREEKMKQLEQAFKIKISRDGTEELVRNVTVAAFPARAPEVFELLALEKAFYTGQPSSTRTHNGKQLSIVFPHKNPTSYADAYYEQAGTKEGGPVIAFEPHERTFSRFYQVALHELAHSEYYQMVNKAPEQQNTLMRALGWKPAKNSPVWLMEGKDGHLYASDFENRRFVRVNESGQALDDSGKVTSDPAKVVQIGYFAMRDFASQRPVSEYFPNHREMAAEALSWFRADASTRAYFFANDADQYAAVKTFDQIGIDITYGRNSDGSSLFIRLPGGGLAENNFLNQMIVHNYEQSLTNGTYKPGAPPPPPPKFPFECIYC